nr:MAG TPA: hypothetical protein [Caudoviricetes sp.]
MLYIWSLYLNILIINCKIEYYIKKYLFIIYTVT